MSNQPKGPKRPVPLAIVKTEAVVPTATPSGVNIEMVSLNRLFCSPANPRRNEAAIEKVAGSIRRFGFRQPIVAKRTGEVLVGNTRLKAANVLRLDAVPVIWWDGSELDATAYMIADNRTAEFSTWDNRSLGALLQTLRTEDETALPDVGFTEDDLTDVLRKAEEERGEAKKRSDVDVPDERPRNAPPENPVTRAGDVWKMGEHRLICGDSKKAETVRALFVGESVQLMLTDPPYCSGGFQEAGKAAGTWGKIASDNLSSRGYQALIREVLAASNPQAIYLFFDWRMWTYLVDIVEAQGLPIRSVIVWDKLTPGLGAVWRAQVEMIVFASRASNHRQKGVAAFGNLVRGKRTGNEHHYTEKPTDVLATLITGDECTDRGKDATIYDPFTGSGSTLIACEAKRRKFRGCEVEPGYCDVAVLRWMDVTQKQAIHEATGKPFGEMRAERVKAG